MLTENEIYADDRGSKWEWMRRLDIGETSPALAEGKETARTIAARIGIRISIKTLENGDFTITRTY